MADLQRLLVATDFSETSDHALDWALELARRMGAAISLMHAYEIPILGFPDGALIATAELASRIADAARTGLNAAIDRTADRGVRVDGVIREGVAWEEINRLADEIDAWMIVIGTHGRRGLSRALLGSVAEKVIRTAHRPVVTIHGARG